MRSEPTPMPVVVVESGSHTLELWLVGSTVALTLVTALTLVVMIHQDHQLVQLVARLVAALAPRRRRTDALVGHPSRDPGDLGNQAVNKVNRIMAPRDAA